MSAIHEPSCGLYGAPRVHAELRAPGFRVSWKRCVARVQQACLCRGGASNTKPFCDNSHVGVGFKSD